MNILQNHGQESVINNPAVPNEHNDAVLKEAGSSITETIKNMMANGHSDQVMQLANDPNGQAAQIMQNGFVQNIMQKFGINADAAQNIAGSLIPQVMSQLNKGGTNGGFDLSSISGMLGKTSLDKDGDGDVDLKDVTKMFGF
ncbi:MAG: hypothetical protein V4561_00445 [Bacteroidota bacterium]